MLSRSFAAVCALSCLLTTFSARFPFDQQINLHKGQNYLYFAVWDMNSGRLGTLQIPFQAAAAPKSQKT